MSAAITAAVGGALVGGMLSADAAGDAADTQANAQLQSARMQAEAAKFKPYNVTTGFGKSIFDTNAETATYELDPRLAAMRDLLYGGATGMAPTAGQQQFYGLMGQQAQQKALQAMGMDVNAAAGQEYQNLQNIMAPQRAAQEASLASNLFKTGRTGYGTSMGTGGYVNPQVYAMQQARGLQDQQMAMAALDKARSNQTQDIQNYFNLAGQAPAGVYDLYNKAQSLFGSGANIEQLGQTPLDLGIGIGGRATNANSAAAQAMAAGMTNAAGYRAANTMGQANMWGNILNNSVVPAVQNYFNKPTSSVDYGASGSLFSSPYSLSSGATTAPSSWGGDYNVGVDYNFSPTYSW